MKLNPFHGLANPRTVWAWGMYDLANQSFTLLINTLLFSIYFKEVVVGDPQRGDSLWSLTFAVSMLLVVVCSPVLGAVADCRGTRKRQLMLTGFGCAVLTCLFALGGPGALWLMVLLYVPANFCFQIGENVLASFLQSVSTPRTIGRVSATGWAMGYVGALILLVLTAGGMKLFGLEQPRDWRGFFVLAGVWFLVNMIPSAIVLREPPTVRPVGRAATLAGEAAHRLMETVRSASRYRQLVLFLSAFFVFGMGVQVIVAFSSIIAKDFGIEGAKLILFVLQLTVTAGLAAVATGFFQDRIGARTTVIIFLGVWIISAAGLLAISLTPDCPEAAFWIAGNGIGFGLGGIGTASRSLVARFTPAHKAAEFFGLWGMVFKLAGVVGVFSFGQVKAWIGMPASLALLLGFFVIGMLMALSVRESAGLRAARRAERDLALAGPATVASP